jgi:hypothetical protein
MVLEFQSNETGKYLTLSESGVKELENVLASYKAVFLERPVNYRKLTQ